MSTKEIAPNDFEIAAELLHKIKGDLPEAVKAALFDKIMDGKIQSKIKGGNTHGPL